jgi:hypothetical protein
MGDPQLRGGERSEAPLSGGASIVERETLPTPSSSPPDPEVTARHVRRRFTTKYKLAILRLADACTQPASCLPVTPRTVPSSGTSTTPAAIGIAQSAMVMRRDAGSMPSARACPQALTTC